MIVQILDILHMIPDKQFINTSILSAVPLLNSAYSLHRFFQEKDDFISRVAEKIASKLSPNDSQVKLERLVNATSDRLVAKMNASEGNVDTFKSQLLQAVKEVQVYGILPHS